MTFMRDTTPTDMRRGIVTAWSSMPSTRKITCMSSEPGSKWMSEAPRRIARLSTELTSLMIGAWSLEPRSVTSLVGGREVDLA